MPDWYSSWMWVIVACASVLGVLGVWGHVLLNALPAFRMAGAAVARRAEEFFYGVCGFSVLGFVAVLLRCPLGRVFWVGTALVLLLALWQYARGTGVSPAAKPTRTGTSERLLRWLAPVLILIGSLLWSIDNLRGLQSAGASFVLVPWVDFFFHARQISNFSRFEGDPAMLHWSMYGETLAPYHYASYIVPALVSRLADIPSLQLATSLYPVLGMLLTGAVMLVLLESRQGALAALAGLVLLYFVPDVTSWIPSISRWFSYYFFQQVGVGGAYATAVCGMALACARRAQATGSPRLTVWAAALLLGAGFFKIQILLAYGVFFYLYFLAIAPGFGRPFKVAGSVAIVAVFLLLAWRASAVPNAPTLGLALDSIADRVAAPTSLMLAFLPPAALLVWTASFGWMLPLVLLLAWKLRRDPASRPALLLALGTLGVLACVRLLLADNHGFGDRYEINRKTFVLPYFVFVSVAGELVGRWLQLRPDPRFDAWRRGRKRRWLMAGSALGAAAAVSGTSIAASRLQVWPGLGTYVHVPVPGGLVQAASYLRTASAPTDVVQLCENDEYNELAVLAERSVYVAKLVVNASDASVEERRRFHALAQLAREPGYAGAARAARELHIDWWVETPNCHSPWTDGHPASFGNAGYSVHHFESSALQGKP